MGKNISNGELWEWLRGISGFATAFLGFMIGLVGLIQLIEDNSNIDAYDAALEINPDSSITIFNKGNALFELGRYDEALTAYEG